MPDIAMCLDADCPMRHNCYRNEASGTKPGDLQSFFRDSPRQGSECQYLWKIEPPRHDE